MPIFDYRCQSCGHEEEIFQKLSDPAPKQCSSCQTKDSLAQKISAPSFRLSGGGWYETLEKPKDKQRNIATKENSSSSAQDQQAS